MKKIVFCASPVLFFCMLLAISTARVNAENFDYYLEASMRNTGGSVMLNGFPSLLKPERESSKRASHWCTPMLKNGENTVKNTVKITFQPSSDNDLSELKLQIVSHPNGVKRDPEKQQEIVGRELSSHQYHRQVDLAIKSEQNRYCTVAAGNLVIPRSDPPATVSMELLTESGGSLQNVCVHLFHSKTAAHVVYKSYTVNSGGGVQTVSLMPEHIVHGRKWLMPGPPFRFSGQAWDKIRQEEVPEDIISLLERRGYASYKDEAAFVLALKKEIGEARTDQYKLLILKHAFSETEFDRILIQCDSATPVTATVSSLKVNGTAFAPTGFKPLKRLYTEWTGEAFGSLPRIISVWRDQFMNVTVRLKKSNAPGNSGILFGEFNPSSFDNEIVLSGDSIVSGSEQLGSAGFDSVRIEGDLLKCEDEHDRYISKITFIDKSDREESLTFSISGLPGWEWTKADDIAEIAQNDKDAIWDIVTSVRNALYNKNKTEYTSLTALKISDAAKAMYNEEKAAAMLTDFTDSVIPQSPYLTPLPDKSSLLCEVYENRKVVKAQTLTGENLIVSSYPVSEGMTEEQKLTAWKNTYSIPLHFSRFGGTWKIVSALY